MSRGLQVEATVRPKVYKVTLRGRSTMICAELVSYGVAYGFEEEQPDPELEVALARYNSKKLAALIRGAVLS